MLPEGSWSFTIPPAGKDDTLPAALQHPLCAPCCRITKPGPHSLLASPLHFQGTRSSGCHPLSRTSPGTEPLQYLLLPRFSPLGSSSTGLRLMGCEGRLPHASPSASASSPCPVSRRIERNTGKACCPRLSRSMTSCRTCSLRVRRLCGGRKKQDEAQRHPTSRAPLQSPFRFLGNSQGMGPRAGGGAGQGDAPDHRTPVASCRVPYTAVGPCSQL